MKRNSEDAVNALLFGTTALIIQLNVILINLIHIVIQFKGENVAYCV